VNSNSKQTKIKLDINLCTGRVRCITHFSLGNRYRKGV